MKSIAICFLIVFSIQLKAQTFEYNFDPNFLSIIDQATGDTVMTASTRIQSFQSLRIQEASTSGYINLRALTNPEIALRDAGNNKNVEILSNFNGSGALRLFHYDGSGVELSKIQLISNFAQTDDSRIITDELEIKGGSDLAELFEVTNDESQLLPGMLVSLDPDHEGKLKLSSSKYDGHVVGVLSGANGVKPGILMGQEGTLANGGELVTISGRTYVRCNLENGPIKIGDLLTSSETTGEAMKATNRKKSRGATIGKAMSDLTDDSGFVLVLVSLQ